CFNWPAGRALLPQLVPEEHFSNPVAWTARSFQIATLPRPALGRLASAPFQTPPTAGAAMGGIAYALFRGPEGVYAIAVTVSILSTILTLRIHPQPASPERELAEKITDKEPVTLRTVLAGFRFIWEKKLI